MRIKPRPEAVTLAVAAFFVLVLNWPFWRLFHAIVAPRGTLEWLFIAATFAALFLLSNLALTLIAFPVVLRVVLGVLLPVTAAASHFMLAYGTLIDVNMVRNIFETNTAEARDLVSPALVLYVAILGILPAALLWRLPVAYRPLGSELKAKTKVAALSVPLIFAAIFPFWGNFVSVFREHRELRLTLTPLNFLSALNRYTQESAIKAPVAVVPFGEDAARADGGAHGRKTLFVIAVGETARADHFQLNGYDRATNPALSRIGDLINYPKAYSCGTDTAQSVPCMFSGLGRENFSNARAAARENLLDILKRAGFDVIWRENQAGCKGVCDRVKTEVLTGLKHPTFFAYSENHDEILLDGLAGKVKTLDQDTVIVLHMMGSHGPAYWKRAPERMEVFKPICREAQFGRCELQEILNAYDNTIVYSDFVLGQLIALLDEAQKHNVDGGMIYMSDHGESLGENNLYLHGMPYAIAPDAQKHVPMVLWLSPSLRDSFKVDEACLKRHAGAEVGHDNLFHSVLGLLNVVTKVYDPALDLFAPCRPATGKGAVQVEK